MRCYREQYLLSTQIIIYVADINDLPRLIIHNKVLVNDKIVVTSTNVIYQKYIDNKITLTFYLLIIVLSLFYLTNFEKKNYIISF